MKNVMENIKGYINKIGKKKIASLLVTCILVLCLIGGTFAIWDWRSTEAQKTMVTVTLESNLRCDVDIGGNITPEDVPVAPTTCTDSKHAIKRELVVKPTMQGDITIYMDLWLDINSIAPELSASENLRYAVTTSDNSCTDGVIVEGTFNGKEDGDRVELFNQKQYIQTIVDTYYLYIWLDAAETNLNTAGKSFDFSINGECYDSEPGLIVTFDANGGDLSTLYTDSGEHTYTVPKTGTYKLEVWGAQGGTTLSYRGGYGGYSVGTVDLNTGDTLYINVGGQGEFGNPSVDIVGGYNGGGKVLASTDNPSNRYVAGGGGASHIATTSGTLKSLSSNKNAILIVAGGGGGGYAHTTGSSYSSAGGDAGGATGKNGGKSGCYGLGASQTAAGTSACDSNAGKGGLGYGGDVGNYAHGSAGGGGYYGGGGSNYQNTSGGGGSGYIGNDLLSNKSMYCYSCTTSNDSNTLTYSTTNVSETPIANYAKSGNGAVRITKLGTNDKIVTNGSTYGELPSPTKNGYTFVGWNTKADGSGTTITSNTIVSLESDIILYAVWAAGNVKISFDANGGELAQIYDIPGEYTYNVPKTGTYKLEVWGAQGGGNGGYGSYSSGNLSLNAETVLYVNIGGQGKLNNGGSNGGGDGQVIAGTVSPAGYGGGGATHIASASGMLKNVNSSKVYIVAGGGGGGSEAEVQGAHAGGYKGNDSTGGCFVATGGTQSSGGSPGDEDATAGGYGYGGSAPYGDESNAYGAGGGGGGYYGGGGNSYYYNNPDCSSAGAGGSGYIGNSLLTDKAMYCYNCSTSNNINTKTYSITNVSEIPTANYAKMGDGAVRITWLGTNDKIVTGGSTYGELPTPSRYKYKFVGWNTKSDGTGETITSETIVNFTEDITLYAIWDDVDYGIVYIYNNGTENTSFAGNLAFNGTDDSYLSKGTSSFTVVASNGDWGSEAVQGVAYFSTPIDLTNYKTLIFEGSFSRGSDHPWNGIGIWSTSTSPRWWDNTTRSSTILTSGVSTIDVSDLTGEYFVGIWGYYNGTSVTCKSMRLES